MPYTTSVAVAQNPGKNYNPLFICGGVGLGKTHLMQAIAHEVIKNQGGRVVYAPYENFLNELISAIQKKTTEAFKKKFRNVDVLLIDDIQFIAKNDFAQDEFFNTFNSLYDAHRQIVISSDRYPQQIPKVEQRLVSRFSWGLVVDIQPPDLETRIAILKKKIEKEPVAIDEATLRFLAESFVGNIRELEGALIRLIAYALFENTGITVDKAKEVLKDIIKEQSVLITPEKIINGVGEYFNMLPAALKTKKRNKGVVLPKQLCMYLIREFTDLSYPEIGLLLGAKHHTTIIHAYNKIKEEISQDKKLMEVVHNIMHTVKTE
jgi:chromosomal replication initiator protein